MADPTVRIVWFRGRAYPISNAPGDTEAGRTWHVFVDGRWEPVLEGADKEMDSAAWRELEARVVDWLDTRTTP